MGIKSKNCLSLLKIKTFFLLHFGNSQPHILILKQNEHINFRILLISVSILEVEVDNLFFYILIPTHYDSYLLGFIAKKRTMNML